MEFFAFRVTLPCHIVEIIEKNMNVEQKFSFLFFYSKKKSKFAL